MEDEGGSTYEGTNGINESKLPGGHRSAEEERRNVSRCEKFH